MRLDLGGVAKGWAADRAAARLARHGPALVDAGGDIAVRGAPSGSGGWPIGVASASDVPWAASGTQRPAAAGRCDGDEPLAAVLLVSHGGVATSGTDYRRWLRDGAWQHHIVDPRTGAPAVTDVLAATVVAPSARDADVAAKVALLLGGDQGLAWVEAHPPLAALLICAGGLQRRSSRLAACLAGGA
jgi:thiamine biosynthesis lipoprotein